MRSGPLTRLLFAVPFQGLEQFHNYERYECKPEDCEPLASGELYEAECCHERRDEQHGCREQYRDEYGEYQGLVGKRVELEPGLGVGMQPIRNAARVIRAIITP